MTKTKPVDDIVAAYECGQRHFGENYVSYQYVMYVVIKKCIDIEGKSEGTFISHLDRLITI